MSPLYWAREPFAPRCERTDGARSSRTMRVGGHHAIGQINIRREVNLGGTFTRDEFERGFDAFRALYNVLPDRAACAPDVIARFCELFEPAGALPHAHSLRLRYRGVAIVAAVLAPGMVAFEGVVDDVKMGDW